jgi:hypothetical protein
MLKWMGPTVLVVAVAVVALGCVRRPAATTAGVEDKAYTAAPASMKARITTGAVTALWHDTSASTAPATRDVWPALRTR